MSPASTPPITYSAKSGVAQKGPLIKGSTVTAQELDATLSPTGTEFTYQVTSDLGAFSPTSTFTSQYVGMIASGYYYDEVQNAISGGQITLNGYADLAVDAVLNVNLLTTLAYQRIQSLLAKPGTTFTDARTQAENEVLMALNIPAGSYGSFDTLDISGSTDGDHILTAISALFVYGNSSGPLSELVAAFQSDIGENGVITNPKTTAELVAAAKGLNPVSIAANLSQEYSADRLTFAATDISDWIAESGDGVIGRFAFQVPDATPSTVFTFPSFVVSQFAGTSVSVTAGQLYINGTLSRGATVVNAGDVVTLSPGMGSFPNGVLVCYLVSGSIHLAKVSFVSGLMSIAIAPMTPSVPIGLTQQFEATGTFSDTSTADLTNSVAWSSGTVTVAAINVATGLATALSAGTTVITATSGSVSGNATLGVTPAVVEAISILPSPGFAAVGINTQLTAIGSYSDGSVQDVTSVAAWTSGAPAVVSVGPSTGVATGVSLGSTTVSAGIASVSATAPLSVISTVASFQATGTVTSVTDTPASFQPLPAAVGQNATVNYTINTSVPGTGNQPDAETYNEPLIAATVTIGSTTLGVNYNQNTSINIFDMDGFNPPYGQYTLATNPQPCSQPCAGINLVYQTLQGYSITSLPNPPSGNPIPNAGLKIFVRQVDATGTVSTETVTLDLLSVAQQ